MANLKPLDIAKDLKYIHVMCKCLGLSPYTINKNNFPEEVTIDYTFKNNIMITIWATIFAFLLFIGDILLVMPNQKYMLSLSVTENVNELVCLPLYSAVASLAIVINLTINKCKMYEFVTKISRIDNKLNRLNKTKYSLIHQKLIPDPEILIFMFIFLPYLVYDTSVWITGDSIAKCLDYRFGNIIDIALILHFCSCIKIIRKRLSKLCKCTEDMIMPILVIPQLRNVLGEICEAARILNSMYGLLVLLEFVKIFLTVIGNITSLITLLYNCDFEKAISFIIWKLIGMAELLYIVITCHMTVTKLNTLNNIIHNTVLSRYPLSTDMFQQIKLFLHQISTCGLEFTACHLFKLDFQFLCGVLASFVTYGVILVQFK
ncbi:hypothetical protein L9F63_024319 [Diploptera punctata]|uniref:Gustatory receptor n=1 Tax=Diploptera punctata TaxID=6984 RepID=A0AAD7ZI54_DIPPU|nr:hypothetical protein L9F63_024319 [Diploptera punctata]